jgi:tripartite-type tricarboxylate transporter receptor subunit TctC
MSNRSENRIAARGRALAAANRYHPVLCVAPLLAAFCAVPAGAVDVQSYPSRPVRIISPFAAGGSNDIVARAVAPKLSELLGQQVVVENRPGAGGVVGTEIGAKSTADGHTLTVITIATMVISPALRKLPYDPVKDFAPIGLMATSPYIVVVHPTVPAKTIRELVALMKAHPAQVEYGSGGVGTPGHLAGAMLARMTGTNMVHVPYKAGNLALNDLLGGHISLTFSNTITSSQLIKSGKVRALAATSSKRLTDFPELPTVAESGVPGYEFTLWLALGAPSATPQPIVRRLSEALRSALQAPDLQQRLRTQAVEPLSSSAEALAAKIKSEQVIYARIVKESGARAE